MNTLLKENRSFDEKIDTKLIKQLKLNNVEIKLNDSLELFSDHLDGDLLGINRAKTTTVAPSENYKRKGN